MKTKLLFTILSLLGLFSFGCLLLGIYRTDLVIIAAGILFGTASALLYLEVKKMMINPFKKG